MMKLTTWLKMDAEKDGKTTVEVPDLHRGIALAVEHAKENGFDGPWAMVQDEEGKIVWDWHKLPQLSCWLRGDEVVW